MATLILTEDNHYEEMDAVREGRATELWACPEDGALQGATRRYIVPGNPRGFDGGEVITLRCGHIIV